MTRFDWREANELAHAACIGAGASDAVARSLSDATLAAERHGKPSVGFAHLLDYLDGFIAGRIDGGAEPVLRYPAGAVIHCDARDGIAQLGFDRAFDELCRRCAAQGVAIFAQSRGFTTGELGYYARRLAEAGIVGIAATNGPALMAAPGCVEPVYCTNPIAFAAPVENAAPLVIDQATSATAFVNLRRAAELDEVLPEGWAIDSVGAATTDARAALKGALLTFGGARGANIALMVEVLAGGLTGANWSLDAPSFASGDGSPGAGLLVLAIAPGLLVENFARRLAAQLDRLAGMGAHIPGRRARTNELELPAALVEKLRGFCRTAAERAT